MKKYIFLSAIVISILGVSCDKYLDTTPQDFISPENYYNTEAEANSALYGLYTVFNDNGNGLYSSNALTSHVVPTDEVHRNNTTGDNTLAYDASSSFLNTYWAQAYRYINNCNSFLENIDKPSMDNGKREVMRAEATFLRAYIYFLLTSQFGDVPVKLSSTQSASGLSIAFTPQKEVYEMVLADMTAAEAKVYDVDQSKQQPTRVSKQVVRGILARVCLYMAGNPLKDVSKYQMARDWAKKVVDAGKNSLNPDYPQIWINIAQDAYDIKESMWEVDFKAPQPPYFRASGWGGQTGIGITCPSTNPDIGYVLDWYKVSYSLAAYYNTDTFDVRRNWNIAPFFYRGATGTWETPRDSLNTTVALRNQKVIDKNPGKLRRKYENVRPATGTSGMNFPILRYSDVLLMYAEAENEISGPANALPLLNQVRTRAKCTQMYSMSATNPYFLITDDKETSRKAIRDERARELCFEFTRRNDLIRWGLYVQTLQAEGQTFIANNYNTRMRDVYARVSERHNLLPIPLTEITLNNLAKQNPGW